MKKLIAILMAAAMLASLGVTALADDYTAIADANNTPQPETVVEYTVGQAFIVSIPAAVTLDGSAQDVAITAKDYNLEPGKTLEVAVTSGINGDGNIVLANQADPSVTIETSAAFSGTGWTGNSAGPDTGYILSLGAIAAGAQAGTYSGTLVFSIALS